MLRLHDTRTRSVEPIVPSTPGRLSVYACGPTVYRYAHVGNLRTFLLTDLIRRTAELQGLSVRLVQNITDVGHLQDDAGIDSAGEDKLLAQAKLEDKSPFAVARFYEDAFHRDLALLNVVVGCVEIVVDGGRDLLHPERRQEAVVDSFLERIGEDRLQPGFTAPRTSSAPRPTASSGRRSARLAGPVASRPALDQIFCPPLDPLLNAYEKRRGHAAGSSR